MLCRTNAKAMSEAMNAMAASGRKVAITGGGREILALAEAAITLKAGTGTSHPELFAFRTWGEVQDYAENDPGGSDLQVLVKLIDDHGPETIIDAVRRLSDERYASLIISTAHKAKGREWDSVRIADDFREPKKDPEKPDELPKISPPEAMLAYVAVTRAKLTLDRSGLAWVDKYRRLPRDRHRRSAVGPRPPAPRGASSRAPHPGSRHAGPGSLATPGAPVPLHRAGRDGTPEQPQR